LIASLKADAGIRKKMSDLPADPQDKLSALALENKRYQEELEQLQKSLAEVEKENKEFAQKYVQVEQQNNHMANLYVASYRLHSTLDFKEAINIIKEIIINLIGSELFALFVRDRGGSNELQPIACEGMDLQAIPPIRIGVGIPGEAAASGESYFADPGDQPKDLMACVPLKVQDELIGMIVVYKLLRQKAGFAPVDLELFSLLADHAATAIYSSLLHTLSERKFQTMRDPLRH
jgi:nitrate/nitrite-specific signal transduction histidine kinase